MPASKPRHPRVTQKEVATAAGVSQMTVSYALRGSELINPETRKVVMQAAEQLGYRPNSSAVAIRQGRAGSVAIIESTTRYRSSFFGGALFDGIESVLAEHDIHIHVARIPDAALTDEGFIPKILREYTADGLLINYIADIPDKLVELIDRYHIPATWINSKHPHNCVYLDDYAGGREATRYLIGLGHTRVAYVDYQNQPPDRADPSQQSVHYSIPERRQGYLDEMASAGLEPTLLYDETREREHNPVAGRHFSRQWLAEPSRPSAIVSFNGRGAMQVIQAATELGMSVPRDLSIVAFEDVPVFDNGFAVTVMRHNFEALGGAASRMLLRRLEDLPDCPDQAPEVRPFELVVGETTAPPRSK